MRTVLRLEDIRPKSVLRINTWARLRGKRAPYPSRAWVAIVQIDISGHIKREFLQPNAMDYSEANSIGSRGVYKCYWLKESTYYEISSPYSCKGSDRYFCKVTNGEIIHMTKEDVQDAQARTG